MKKLMILTGWLVMAAALTITTTACSSEDNIADEPTPTTTDAPKTYTLTVTASKLSGDATTRALSLGGAEGKTLNATWTADDAVQVYHVSNPGTPAEEESTTPDATLHAQSAGVTTTLTGTFDGSYTPAAGDVLRLRFNDNPNYTNQEGTLDYIAAHCDYATAEITVASVDAVTGDVTATGTASFANQQAIVKFSLKQPDGTTPLAATSMTVKVGSTTYNVTPTSAASDIFVAIKKASNKTVTLRATDGTDHFRYEKSGVSFAVGQYYAIGVKMTMTSINLSTLTSNYTAQDGDMLKGTLDGNTQPYKISIADGATVTLSGVTINGIHDGNNYSWAGITCLGDATIILNEGTTNTVKGFQYRFPGILSAVGKTLTIKGTGTLNASSNGYATGIGGGYGISCGNIRIESGTICATGGSQSAGIGSGAGSIERGESCCGTITISGGTVTATGGSLGAGIGSGYAKSALSSCDAIRIEGGTVTATAGQNVAAIGKGNAESGYTSSCASITFTTDITSLTLNNPDAIGGSSAYAESFLNAGQVMAGAVDITGSLSGFNGVVKFFNSRNSGFYNTFPNSSFNESTLTWTIAP